MLIVDVSEVKLPGEAKPNNPPPECGQPIDAGAHVHMTSISYNIHTYVSFADWLTAKIKSDLLPVVHGWHHKKHQYDSSTNKS
jgi:hypothetical protein